MYTISIIILFILEQNSLLYKLKQLCTTQATVGENRNLANSTNFNLIPLREGLKYYKDKLRFKKRARSTQNVSENYLPNLNVPIGQKFLLDPPGPVTAPASSPGSDNTWTYWENDLVRKKCISNSCFYYFFSIQSLLLQKKCMLKHQDLHIEHI